MKRFAGWFWAALAVFSIGAAALVGVLLHARPSWGQPVESAAATAAALLTAITAVAASMSASTSAEAARTATRALALHWPPRMSYTVHGGVGEPTMIECRELNGVAMRSLTVSWTPRDGAHQQRRVSPVPPKVSIELTGAEATPSTSGSTDLFARLKHFELRIRDASGVEWVSKGSGRHQLGADPDDFGLMIGHPDYETTFGPA